ncbi:MAG: TetR/AcrR family transcriptional regulator [Alphaproteobacteria bacterium]|nr:MAG: TetR/AcrR family transcriptional regulator [Alphaproteobacteria bacterium]
MILPTQRNRKCIFIMNNPASIQPTHTPAPRGRPADPRKDAQIIMAADKLFMQHGVAGTTMEHIARDADVSKLTLYRRYPDKNTLFTAVISERCRRYMPDSLFETSPDTDPHAVLVRIGCALIALITSESSVNLNRIITTESAHNPQLTAQFYAEGPQRIRNLTLDLMKTFNTEGHVAIDDPAEAAEMFSALIVGCEYCKRCNMNMCPTPTHQQIEAYVKKAASFFLRAYTK